MRRALQLMCGRGLRAPPLAALVLLAAAVVMATGAGTAQAVSLVTNGSFELGISPPITGFRTLTSTSHATDITGWTVTAGSVDWISTTWPAADGLRSLDLSGTNVGTIAATTFATTPGMTYEVDFWMSGNPAAYKGDKVLRVTEVSGTTTSQDFIYNTVTKGNTLSDMKWEEMSWVFTAQSTSAILSFQSLTANAYGPALDNVAVYERPQQPDPIPEPVTMAGMLLGVVSLAGYFRGRRKA